MVVRTTIRMDPELVAGAKRLGRDTGRTLKAVIEDAVREALRRGQPRPRRAKPLPVSVHASRVRPGVNLDSWANLLDLMEAPDDPARR